MCLTISAPVEGEQIEILFALENVLLTKEGAKRVRVDLLIHNIGQKSIGRFRIELPSGVMPTSELTEEAEDQSFENYFLRLCKKQLHWLEVDTELLTRKHAEDNWLYRDF